MHGEPPGRPSGASVLMSSRYQRAYIDFFEDQLVLNGYDWKKVLDEYLFKGRNPLINCIIAGRTSLSQAIPFSC